MATPIDVVVLKCKIGETVRYSLDNKNSAPSWTVAAVATARIAPKGCLGQPPTFGSQCSKFQIWQFGGVIAERVKAVLWAHRVNHYSPEGLRANNNYVFNDRVYPPTAYTGCFL